MKPFGLISAEGKRLLDEIASCPVVAASRGGDLTPCSKVVSTQSSDAAPYQPPEPWSGLVESAAILFLSSNPSIDEKGTEEYPDSDWPREKVRSYFTFRFGGGTGEFNQIKDGVKPPLRSGGHGRSVPFWRAAKQHATDILGYAAVPGVDYALSEMVHCKSRREIGVKQALSKCTSRYLDRLLQVAAAPVIIVLGSRSREACVLRYPEAFDHSPPFGTVVKADLGSRPRLVSFMPHPNAHMKRKMTDEELLPAAQLNRLRDAALVQPVCTGSPPRRQLRLLSHQHNVTLGYFTLHVDGAVTCDPPGNVDILRGLRLRRGGEDSDTLFTRADGWSNGYVGTQAVPLDASSDD